MSPGVGGGEPLSKRKANYEVEDHWNPRSIEADKKKNMPKWYRAAVATFIHELNDKTDATFSRGELKDVVFQVLQRALIFTERDIRLRILDI